MSERVKLFVQIGRVDRGPGQPPKFKANVTTTRPSINPLQSGSGGYSSHPIPTIGFAVEFLIPPEAFEIAERTIAEVAVPLEAIEPAQIEAEVPA